MHKVFYFPFGMWRAFFVIFYQASNKQDIPSLHTEKPMGLVTWLIGFNREKKNPYYLKMYGYT